ncbi:hypothetical protein KDV51_07115 [Citrobacter portucalensis]|uniref:hypothetical protein n=1 Tax=Citrobacter portucalensis TaxID=1639133 RepID=UPI00333C9992
MLAHQFDLKPSVGAEGFLFSIIRKQTDPNPANSGIAIVEALFGFLQPIDIDRFFPLIIGGVSLPEIKIQLFQNDKTYIHKCMIIY